MTLLTSSSEQQRLPLDELINRPPDMFWRYLARLVMFLLFSFLIWATVAHLQEVSIAKGEVVPQEQMQSIQHLEGGIVEKIFVKEGARVAEGEPLVQLNITSFVSTKEDLQIQHDSLLLKRESLQAEAEGKDKLIFSKEAAGLRANLIAAEQQAFDGRRREFESSMQLLQDQVRQRKLDVEQLQEERSSIQRNLSVLREKLKISQDLVKDKLTSRLDHLQLKSEVEELSGKLKILEVAIPRAQAALQEAEERYRNEEIRIRNTALEELTRVEADIARVQESLQKAQDQVLRTTIKSPIKGTVKALNIHTVGGVVQPGETIMEIVPESANLVIETRLDPNDIGFVKVGQRALVKLMTYDYSRYGGLDGEVIYISPDSHMDPATGEVYFLVVIRTDNNYLGSEPGLLPITPGMQATVDIKTGKKTVMEYLLKPVLKITEEAFRER